MRSTEGQLDHGHLPHVPFLLVFVFIQFVFVSFLSFISLCLWLTILQVSIIR